MLPLLKLEVDVSNALQLSFLDVMLHAFVDVVNEYWGCCDPSSSISQLFVFVCAEFETSKHESNQVRVHFATELPFWTADGG